MFSIARSDWYPISALESLSQGTCGVYLDVTGHVSEPAAILLSIRTYIFAVRIIRLFMYTLNLCLFDLCYSNTIEMCLKLS